MFFPSEKAGDGEGGGGGGPSIGFSITSNRNLMFLQTGHYDTNIGGSFKKFETLYNIFLKP